MNLSILIFFLPLIFPSLGILRPNPNNLVEKPEPDRRQGPGNPRPFVPRPIHNPSNSNNQQQQSQQMSPPSRDLLPPLVSPISPVVQSNALPPSPSFEPKQQSPPEKLELLPPLEIPPEFPIGSVPPQESNNFNSNGLQFQGKPQVQSEKLELLPPLEIPPEAPIDNLSVQSFSQSNSNNRPRPIVFESSPVDQFSLSRPFTGSKPLQLRPPSSLLPTTGTGSGGPFANPDLRDVFPKPSTAEGQRQIFSQNIAPAQPTPAPTLDPGLNCLGSCDCPPDFNFVCGNNRFLYQNDCALECDKRCNPGLVKVGMDECS